MEETKKELTTEEKKGRLKKLWDDYSDVIISIGLIAVVYRAGYSRGYNMCLKSVDAAFKSLADAATKF